MTLSRLVEAVAQAAVTVQVVADVAPLLRARTLEAIRSNASAKAN